MLCYKDKKNRQMYTGYFNLDQRSKNGMRRAYTSRHNGPNGSNQYRQVYRGNRIMITPKNIIYTAMYNKGIKSVTELVEIMNKGSEIKYEKSNTNATINGTQVYAHYMRRIEEVLGFQDKSLLNMYEVTTGPLKNRE